MNPNGWKEVRLGDLGSTFGGLTGKSARDFGNGDSSFVTFMNVMSNVVLREDGTERVDVKAGEAQAQLRPGDLIFNGSSETPEEVGFAAVVPRELGGVYLNSFCFGFRCNPDVELDPRFFAYLTRSPVGRGVIRPMAQGSTRYNLAKTNLLNGRFLLPPKREQQVIAEALSNADALVESLDALIAKKRDMKQAAMQQLLTGRTRLPGFSGEWLTARLGELGEISGAGVDKKILQHEIPVRLLNYLDVYRRSVITSADLAHWVTARPDQLRRCAVKRGDIFFTPTSEVPGDICRSSVALEDIKDAVYSYHVVRLRLAQEWDLQFRAHAFSGKDFLDQSAQAAEGSGTRYVVTLPRFRSLTIRYPADPAEQGSIGAVLADMDAEIDALVAQREKADLVKQGMMQELLSGRVRLV